MRFAVTADLHGRRKAWRRFRAGAAAVGADRLIILGDYLEAEVPWRRHDPTRRWALDEVVEPDPELWAQLAAEAELVLGNQEMRIRDLLRPEQVPDGLVPLLSAPETIQFGAAFGMHGHQLHWYPAPAPAPLPPPPPPPGAPGASGQSPPTPGQAPAGVGSSQETVLVPGLAELPEVDLLMVGHSHQTLLLDMAWPRGERQRRRGGWTRRVAVTPGVPVRLDVRHGPGCEVGPGAAVGPAGWPVGGSGAQDRMLFVNVGPARGKPTRWLLYDDERKEIIFWEAW